MLVIDRSDRNPTMAPPMQRVGYAYVPMQQIGETYTPEKALMQGTLFPELDIPYGKYGKQYND